MKLKNRIFKNKEMFSYYVKTCKRCKYFVTSDYGTRCFRPNSPIWELMDLNVDLKYKKFLYYFPEILEGCQFVEKDANSHIEKLRPESEKYKKIFLIIFYLLIALAVIVISSDFHVVPSILFFIITILGFRFWVHKKGYWKFPTEEERKMAREVRKMESAAIKEENMEKWSGPIKSAHIIRLERGLYTGLGNRRPYPHGRRTKKY